MKRKVDSSKANHIILIILLALFVSLIIYLIVNQISEMYAQQDPILEKIKNHIAPLYPDVVSSLKFFEGNKSYTINKRKIYLCLRDENQEYYDYNMLIYVALHELSHVMCDEIGHTPKFHSIFREVLKKAAGMGIYDPEKPIIMDYCGHQN